MTTLEATIAVRVQPRARKDEILTVRDGRLVVRLTAPPLEGRANDALCALLAKSLGLRASQASVIRGERARDKLVRIDGVDQTTADRKFGLG